MMESCACSRSQANLLATLAVIGLSIFSTATVAEPDVNACLGNSQSPECLAQRSFETLPTGNNNTQDEPASDLVETRAKQFELWQKDYIAASQSSGITPPFEKAELQKIVSELALDEPEADEKSWIQRFIDWLTELVKDPKKEGDAEPPQWLVDFLESFDEESLEKFAYWMPRVMFGLLLLMLAWIVYREIRAAREGGTKGIKNQQNNATPPLHTLRRSKLQLSDAMQAPPRQRPSALLRVAIQHLADAGELPRDSSLTNRELSKSLGISAPNKTAGFKKLCHAAEDTLYGNTEPGNELLEQLANTVETLFQSPHKPIAS